MDWDVDPIEAILWGAMAVCVAILIFVCVLAVMDLTSPTETVYLCPECSWEGEKGDMDKDSVLIGHVIIVDYHCPECGRELDDSWYSKEVPK